MASQLKRALSRTSSWPLAALCTFVCSGAVPLFAQAPTTPAEAPKTAAPESSEQAPEAEQNTPEATLKAFILAMMSGNEKQIRAMSLPISDEDMKLLTENAPPPNPLAALMIGAMPIQSLKPGDQLTLPGGKKITIGADEVTEDRKVLVPADSPIPTRLQRVEGTWRVDPAPFIAARRAVIEVMKKRGKNPPPATRKKP